MGEMQPPRTIFAFCSLQILSLPYRLAAKAGSYQRIDDVTALLGNGLLASAILSFIVGAHLVLDSRSANVAGRADYENGSANSANARQDAGKDT